jgi:hypothetical protein
MRRVAHVDGAQIVIARSEIYGQRRVAFGVEYSAGKLPAAVFHHHRAAGGQAVFTGNAQLQCGFGVPALVLRLRRQCRLRRLHRRRFSRSSKNGRGNRQCGRGKRNEKPCSQFEPQTAAKITPHVHLLQVNRKIAFAQVVKA